MLRLRLLTSAIVIVDTMLWAALVPLLPYYRDELGLSKSGAGIIVAAYAAGALLASVPGGVVASRYGPKRAVMIGLTLMAVSSVGFGFAEGEVALVLTRFAQGVGSALSWAGSLSWLVAATPRERRGEMLGTAIGAAIFGALLGPVLGAFASLTSPEIAFTLVGLLGAGLALWASAMPGAAAEPQPVGEAFRALRRPEFAAALWFMVLPSFLFGVLAVLVPLRLDDAGWSAAAIGAVFLVAAAFEIVVSPLIGRLSDRVGRLAPIRVSALASLAVALALAWASSAALVAILVVAGALVFGSFWAPASALLSDAADRRGLAQGLAFGLMNLAWATGNVVGPAAGGALADVGGDALPFGLAAALSALTAVAVVRHRSPGTQMVRVPGDP